MLRYLSLLAASVFAFSLSARTLYSCFLSQDLNMKTGQVTNQITNNSLLDIYVEGNKLLLGNKKFSMYNRQTSYSGFVEVINYDAIDNNGQRCKIKFITDSSADWAKKNAILIWYNEISQIAKWYQSREPQEL